MGAHNFVCQQYGAVHIDMTKNKEGWALISLYIFNSSSTKFVRLYPVSYSVLIIILYWGFQWLSSMNQCIIKRIIFYHPIQNLLVQCRFTEFIQFFVYTLACQIFEHDCIGLLKTMEFLDCYTCVLVLERKSKWFWLVGVFYITCASGFELTHTLNTLYNHIHVQYCSTLLCTYKIWVLDTSK